MYNFLSFIRELSVELAFSCYLPDFIPLPLIAASFLQESLCKKTPPAPLYGGTRSA
ncbi:hypothetical protein D3C74_90170 [compost metagenome]